MGGNIPSSDSKPLVVVVDDDEQNIALVRRACRGVYEVLGFVDPTEALAALRDRSSDVETVLSDLRMPGMSGAELLERVYEIDPTIECTLVTAFGDDPRVRSVRDAGVTQRLVMKPFNVDTLRSYIGMSVLLTRLRRSMQGIFPSTEKP